MSQLHVSAAPHIHSGNTTEKVMRDVVIAMLPAVVASVILFGIRAAAVIAACVIGAVVSELLFCKVVGKKSTVSDFSAVVTGLLLGLNLSTNVPLWQCVVGAAFAIVIAKCLFGGLGNNIVNAIGDLSGCSVSFGDSTLAVDRDNVRKVASAICASGAKTATVIGPDGGTLVQQSIDYRTMLLIGTKTGVQLSGMAETVSKMEVRMHILSDDGRIDIISGIHKCFHI